MYNKQVKKTSYMSWVLIALMLSLAGAAVYIVKVILSDDNPKKNSYIANVTLLKPPPPPPIKEKPPEPEPLKEIQKKEEIIDPVTQNEPQSPQNADSHDNTPAGNNLGVDAEGGAGGDAFGLVGKKGGRSIIAGGEGGLGKLSLLSKFSGYTHIAETEMRKRVIKHLEEEGGIPKGKLQAVARISLDSDGIVVECRIIGSSGNHNMDNAINQALSQFKISEPPPDGMPRKMAIRFTYQS
jgi:TonB family protein